MFNKGRDQDLDRSDVLQCRHFVMITMMMMMMVSMQWCSDTNDNHSLMKIYVLEKQQKECKC